jgi:hypothetical protein
MEQKESLIRDIDYLKKDIQYIIDKKKAVIGMQQLQSLDDEKKIKLQNLTNLSEDLKRAVRQEKELKQKQVSIQKVSRAVDSLEFGGAKRGNNAMAMEKAKQMKVSRDKARDQYMTYLEYEIKYNNADPADCPGMLFLHESVIKAYDVCPFIKFEVDVNTTDVVRAKRQEWLASQPDGGQVYFQLFDKVVTQCDVNSVHEVLEATKADIDKFIESNLSDSQKEMFDWCKEFIQDYVNSHIKTKRVKEKYKLFIHKLSMLYAETNLNVHKYLGLSYKQDIMINDMRTTTNTSTTTRLLVDMLSGMLTKYKEHLEACEVKMRFVKNTIRHLKNELYLMVTNQKRIAPEPGKASQKGKYFKRWTLLSETERNDRFLSFADYYIERFMVQENILDIEKKSELVCNLSSMLSDFYKEKKLIYRNFKWNMHRGIIEAMPVLKYSKTDSTFFLSDNAGKQTTKSQKRKVSTKSILNKENEKIINEEILYFIVRNCQNTDNEQMSKQEKDQCIDQIKSKLKLKKLMAVDKTQIEEKIETMFKVVKLNNCN